jgi:transketolase
MAALKRRTGPTLLLLTRHNLPVIDRKECAAAANVEKGAYVLWQSAPGTPQLILIASGSEVSTVMTAARELAAQAVVRVVSMPSWDLFEAQPAEYRASVLPAACPVRLALEAGVTQGWEKYVGPRGRTLGVDHYGASAPYQTIAEQFGFTPAHVVAAAREMLALA